MRKRILSTLLALCMVLTLLPGRAGAAETSGSCGKNGNNVTWTLDSSGLLTISGTGEMADYTSHTATPWYENRAKIESVAIGNGVTHIGNFAFRYLDKLSGVTISNGLLSIGNNSFSNCTALTAIVIPDSVTSIGSGAFWCCLALSSIKLSDNLVNLGYGAFGNNHALTHIEIPSNVRNIERGPFTLCDNLTTITVAATNTAYTSVDGVLFSKDMKTLVQYPMGKPSTSYTIPNGVTSIKREGFSDCANLKEVTIPKSVTLIDLFAFDDCDNLSDVYYSGSEGDWNEIKIESNNRPLTSATIHYTNTSEDPTPSAPAAPTISLTTSATIPEGTATGIRWDAVPGAERYYVYAFNKTLGTFFVQDRITYETSVDFGPTTFPGGEYEIYVKSDKNGVLSKESNHVILTVTNTMSPVRITLNKTKVEMAVGAAIQLTATTTPAVEVSWYTNLPRAAAVDRKTGEVYAAGVGEAIITAVAERSSTTTEARATCEIIVKEKCTVSYDLAGGTGNVPGAKDCAFGEIVFIPSEAPTYNGRKFLGWSDGTNIYQPGEHFRMSGFPTVLTAQWDNDLIQKFIRKASDLVGKTGQSLGFSSDWCASFVDLCARDPQVKIPTAIVPSCSGTGTLLATTGTSYYFDDWEYELASQDWDNYLKYALKVERFNPKLGTGFVPQNGDLVFIRWKNNNGRYPPHVGIVCDVDTQRHTMTIIDGNAGSNSYLYNKVKVRTGIDYTAETISSMDNCTLMAYARPDWNGTLPVSSGEVYGLLKCPINVSISYNNEELNSATGQLVTSFGTMSVGDTGDGIAFHLNNYYDVETVITGTGTGTMDFSIRYVDDDGTSNSRVFQGVPITNDTVIEVEDNNNTAGEVLLKIFRNHGNTFVEAWQAINEESVMGPNTDLTNWYLENKEPESVIPVSPSNPTQSSIAIPSTPNGKITPSITFPAPGDWVTLTPAPDAGYELTSLTVTSRYGQNVPVTALSDGRYAFTMPDSEVTVNAVFSKSPDTGYRPGTNAGYGGYADVVYPGPAMAFTDVQPGDWFYDSVNYVYTRRLMNGVSAAAFDPQGVTSRAMIWTVLARLSGRDTTGGATWYERGRIWAMGKGITDGTAPEGSVTREQLVTMLWRFQGSPYSPGTLTQFTDSGDVSPYAVSAVGWAADSGLLKGDNGRLNPQGTATRAEVAAILQRFCQ